MTQRTDVAQMYQWYKCGDSLEQVGQRVGLTRERIRQLFEKHKLPKLSLGERRALDLLHVNEALRLFQELGDERAVAQKTGLPVAMIKRILAERLPNAKLYRPRPQPRPRYSDEELVQCLVTASAAIGGVLRVGTYKAFAKSQQMPDGRPWPGNQTLQNRFGTWRNALGRAGLRGNKSSPILGQRLFEPEHCIDAIREVARSLQRVPTAREYEEYAGRAAGAVPSLATIRHRFDSWHSACQAALANVASSVLASS